MNKLENMKKEWKEKRDRAEQFENEHKKLCESDEPIARPVFSWYKFRIVCPSCMEVLKLKRRYFSNNVAYDIVEYKSKIVVVNYNQIFYCSKCGYRSAQRYRE